MSYSCDCEDGSGDCRCTDYTGHLFVLDSSLRPLLVVGDSRSDGPISTSSALGIPESEPLPESGGLRSVDGNFVLGERVWALRRGVLVPAARVPAEDR
ncbi:MAG: hypothetical protein HYY06_07580 [Deltaproteobacteria bacterium]|nr:hypothetical protein [Deltaproteobacteria bacterium]